MELPFLDIEENGRMTEERPSFWFLTQHLQGLDTYRVLRIRDIMIFYSRCREASYHEEWERYSVGQF